MLSIGNLQFDSNLIQGPLAGYTCSPMRVQTWKHSQPAYCSTEMVSSTHLIHAKKEPRRYIERDAVEGPLCFQLSANNPDTLAKATRMVDQLDVDMIELNCGCPVRKIRSKGSGSRLLSQTDNLKRLITALRENTDKAVSIKVRVSGDANDQDDLMIAEIIEELGADCLVVHGRHWTERYDVDCRFNQISQFVRTVNIPVIGNGDVECHASLKKMLDETNCAGVMIARASMGQPWLFSQLSQSDYELPSVREMGETYIDHINRLAELDSPFRALLQGRKIGKYYARNHLADKAGFIKEIMQCTEMPNFYDIVKRHFA